jgi:energy-coupling factor transport system ATP-binding protein
MILLDRLCFSYTEATEAVFRDFDLGIACGSWVVMTGPDGGGKSTLGKLIAGLLRPQSGSVRIEGGQGRRGITVGYLGGDPYDNLVGITVEEDVAFGLENRGMEPGEIAAKIDEALGLTGLRGMERRLTHTLSGGEQQKLGLASMLALDARVLILDEAFCMLDRPTRQRVRSLLGALRCDRGVTILEITQQLEDALTADRLVFLSCGRVEFDGPPGSFLTTEVGETWSAHAGGLPAVRSALCQRLGHPDAWRLVDQWMDTGVVPMCLPSSKIPPSPQPSPVEGEGA